MQEYAITKDGNWITGNIQKGCYVWTSNKERRYTFEDINKAIAIAKEHPGSEVIGEHSHLTVYPETDELCSWCRCSLAYGYIERAGGSLFCSESCYQDATGEE
jgi:hypothetical protein